MVERPSTARLILRKTRGLVLVTSDLHGNYQDYLAVRAAYEGLLSRDPDAVWVSLGDWVHGPPPGGKLRADGRVAYDYEDRSCDLVRHLFTLGETPGVRFHTLLGNHEHAHVGGRPVGRFRPDEAKHLESCLQPEEVRRMRRMFLSWPLVIQLPACGVIFTHGAPDDDVWGPALIDDACYDGPCPRDSAAFLEGVLWNYGYVEPGGGRGFLDRMSTPIERYDLIVHGHDRHADGGGADGAHAYLLCTSFGAREARKAFLVLDVTRRYTRVEDLGEGREIFRLHPGA